MVIVSHCESSESNYSDYKSVHRIQFGINSGCIVSNIFSSVIQSFSKAVICCGSGGGDVAKPSRL